MRVRDAEFQGRSEYVAVRLTWTELRRFERIWRAYFGDQRASAVEYVVHLLALELSYDAAPVQDIEPELELRGRRRKAYLGSLLETQEALLTRWRELVSRKRPIAVPKQVASYFITVAEHLEAGTEPVASVPANLVPVAAVPAWHGAGSERRSERLDVKVTPLIKAHVHLAAKNSDYRTVPNFLLSGLARLEWELGLERPEATYATPRSFPTRSLVQMSAQHGHAVHSLCAAWATVQRTGRLPMKSHGPSLFELARVLKETSDD